MAWLPWNLQQSTGSVDRTSPQIHVFALHRDGIRGRLAVQIELGGRPLNRQPSPLVKCASFVQYEVSDLLVHRRCVLSVRRPSGEQCLGRYKLSEIFL